MSNWKTLYECARPNLVLLAVSSLISSLHVMATSAFTVALIPPKHMVALRSFRSLYNQGDLVHSDNPLVRASVLVAGPLIQLRRQVLDL